MTMKVAEVLETVMEMTREQRADLACQVLLTLDEPPTGEAAASGAAWREEIGRRVDDYLGGNPDVVAAEKSHGAIRAELAAKGPWI
ncbi:MAG: addiction module protein [Bifidobacteriaceae bacterium]|jgi:hypothetical protein|nr:addiction module protein [Bifidobacteriaceae bacterium]